jgi:hypothetical protein
MKRNPLGVFFKLFSDSLKLKILLRDLVSLHTRQNEIQRHICSVIFYPFLGLNGQFMKKVHPRSYGSLGEYSQVYVYPFFGPEGLNL